MRFLEDERGGGQGKGRFERKIAMNVASFRKIPRVKEGKRIQASTECEPRTKNALMDHIRSAIHLYKN
eukprot:510209-Amorphochlora_amoeboformis.AAC.1